MTDLGLDRAAAALMYRAERLQEKGQLQQALRYFERVLSTHAGCQEAAVNARMIHEQLSEQAGTMPVIRENEVATPAPVAQAPMALQTAEMQISETFHDCERYEAYWSQGDMDDAMLQKAKDMLEKHGISTPFVALVSNTTEKYTPPVHEDPWMDATYTCRAVVRVTFPLQALRPQHTASHIAGAGATEFASLFASIAAAHGTSTVALESASGNRSDGIRSLPSAGSPSPASAAVSQAGVQSSVGGVGGAQVEAALPKLHLLEYSRTPRCFHDALLERKELSECVRLLEASSLASELDGGLKIFVPPELYGMTVSALKSRSERLQSRHVVASDSYVQAVREAIAGIPSKHQVRVKSATSLEGSGSLQQDEVGAAALFDDELFPVEVKHTFLHIAVPSSVRSDSNSDGTAHTAPPALGA